MVEPTTTSGFMPFVTAQQYSCPTEVRHYAQPTAKRFAKQFNHRIMRPMETAVEQTRAIRRQEIVGKFPKRPQKRNLVVRQYRHPQLPH